MDNRRQILDRFGQQAERFERRGTTVANREQLQWAASFLELAPSMRALDVAGGTGLMARTIAPRIRRVVVLDLTPEMLQQARTGADEDGLANIALVRGDGEHLPFSDGSFEVVMSRYSFHHMPEPSKVLAEMARVAGRSHQVAVIDLISPDDPSLARSYNQMETLRDPSHTRALARRELETLVSRARLRVLRSGTREIETDLEDWLALAAASPAAAEEIRHALRRELQGGPPTGMRPVQRDTLLFTQTALTLVATR